MGVGATKGTFTVRLFDVVEDGEYYVEANGVRSPSGTLTVKDLPGVQRIGVELRFPSYMNMAPEVTEDGGDIAAPGGTTAVLRVHTTRPVTGGKLIFDGNVIVPLEPLDDSTVTARLSVRRDGFYRVELTADDGTVVRGTVEYAVDALEDAAPSVRIRQPGRDLRPTSVDEVLIEAEATDDYTSESWRSSIASTGARRSRSRSQRDRACGRAKSSHRTRSFSRRWRSPPEMWSATTRVRSTTISVRVPSLVRVTFNSSPFAPSVASTSRTSRVAAVAAVASRK